MKRRKLGRLMITIAGVVCLTAGCGAKSDEAKLEEQIDNLDDEAIEERIEQLDKMEDTHNKSEYVTSYEDMSDKVFNLMDKVCREELEDDYQEGCHCKPDYIEAHYNSIVDAHRDYDSYELVGVCVAPTPESEDNFVGLVYELHFSSNGDVTTYELVFDHDVKNIDSITEDVFQAQTDRSVCVVDGHGYLGKQSIEEVIEIMKDKWAKDDNVEYTDLTN